MSRFAGFFLGWLAVAGCSVSENDAVPALGSFRVSAPVIDARCPLDRHIARTSLPAGVCPPVPGWTGTNLLEAGNPYLQSADVDLVGELGRYCRYQWKGPGTLTGAAVSNLYATEGLQEPGSDCNAIEAQSGGLGEVLGGPLQDLFRQEAGRVPASGLKKQQDGASTEATRSPVTVMVIDTMPENPVGDPTSEHGRAMIEIIDDIACPGGGPCAVTTEAVLGLPRIEGGKVNYASGGYFGSYGDLAAALIEAIERWRAANLAGNPTDLVINLSVGFDRQIFELANQPAPAPIDAMQAALKYAACHGALVFAAAGNDVGMCTDGALYPAAWEDTLAPPPTACQAIGVGFNPYQESYHPLVHAVAGVDAADTPLGSTRELSMPRLVAYADHVVTGPTPTTSRTGSSNAAAIASGTAALAWSYAPVLTGHQVARTLYESGSAMPGLMSEVRVAGEPSLPVTQIDACEALLAACDQAAACPELAADCSAPASITVADIVALAEADAGEGIPIGASVEVPLECTPACGDPVLAYGDKGTGYCVELELDAVDRMAAPQPPEFACANCSIEPKAKGSTLYGELDLAWLGFDVPEVDLIVVDGDGKTHVYPLGLLELEVGVATRFDLDYTLPETIVSTELVMTFPDPDEEPSVGPLLFSPWVVTN